MKFLFAAPVAALVMLSPAHAQEFKPYAKAAFDQMVASGQPVLVHVHADWCPVCKRQQGVLGPLMREQGFAKVNAVVVDFDKETAFKTANKVTGQSTLIVFKGGKEVGRAVGATDPAALRALVSKAL